MKFGFFRSCQISVPLRLFTYYESLTVHLAKTQTSPPAGRPFSIMPRLSVIPVPCTVVSTTSLVSGEDNDEDLWGKFEYKCVVDTDNTAQLATITITISTVVLIVMQC